MTKVSADMIRFVSPKIFDMHSGKSMSPNSFCAVIRVALRASLNALFFSPIDQISSMEAINEADMLFKSSVKSHPTSASPAQLRRACPVVLGTGSRTRKSLLERFGSAYPALQLSALQRVIPAPSSSDAP